jgi:DNA replication protein DnaC
MRPTIHNYLKNIRTMTTKPAGLLLTGEAGVGKTAIAALILKEARAYEFTGLFISTWDLRECIRNRVDFDEAASMTERCRDVDVLVLDNIREEDTKEAIVNDRFIEELVTFRSARKRLTILTTSMSMDTLDKSMSSLKTRIQDSVVPVKVVGPDQRAEAAKALSREVIVMPKKK